MRASRTQLVDVNPLSYVLRTFSEAIFPIAQQSNESPSVEASSKAVGKRQSSPQSGQCGSNGKTDPRENKWQNIRREKGAGLQAE
jgi:hypothetical protein